jgi:hypothetical protein
MTTAAWPTTVSYHAAQGSYREKPEDNVDRFDPEVGDSISRRRTAQARETITFESIYTRDEYAALKAWRRSTILDGTLPFTRPHPFTGVTGTFKYMQDGFSLVQDMGMYVRVAHSLKVLA